MKTASAPVLLALVFIAGAVTSGATPKFVKSFGSSGAGPGQFDRPFGLDAAPDGTVYVADSDNNRISYFNGSGKVLGSFGSAGSGPGQFGKAYCVSVSPDGSRVLVSDYGTGRVQVFSRTGSFLRMFYTGGQPLDVKQRPDGRILLCDFTSNRISLFSAGGSLLDTHEPGDGLNSPSGIALFPDGRFVVADSENGRCVIFSESGKVIRTFGTPGSGPGQFINAAGVAIAGNRNIFVTDSSNNNVQIFSNKGSYLGSFGSTGSGPGQLVAPSGIAVLPNGRIYVAEFGNDRVSVFRDPGVKSRPTVKIRGGKKIRATGRVVTLRGKAEAASGTLLDKVIIKVGGKKPKVAKGTAKWTCKLRLGNRASVARAKVYSIDRLGQKSKVSRIRVIRRP